MRITKNTIETIIRDYLAEYGPSTAREIAEGLNREANGKVLPRQVANVLIRMTAHGDVEKIGKETHVGIIYQITEEAAA